MDDSQDQPALDPVAAPGGESPPEKLSRSERREKAAADGLRTLIRDLYTDLLPVGSAPEEFSLSIDLSVHPGQGWELKFQPGLREQLLQQFEDVEAKGGEMPSGKVFCFRDDGTACEHAAPGDCSEVFKEYDSTGTPLWCSLTQFLLDQKHPDVARLYDAKAPVLCALTLGRDLKSKQLSSFGRASRTYALLGQIVLGYLTLPKDLDWSDPPRERVALTFQFVEMRRGRNGFELKINILCGKRSPEDLHALLVHPRMNWLYRVVDTARQQLESIAGEVRLARARKKPDEISKLLGRVAGVMRKMERNLSRGDRQTRRRTVHAEERRSEGQRPVQAALKDVQNATLEAVFFDLKKETLVVRGRNNRAHVFNRDGRLVTSFTIDEEAVSFRIRTERWRRATQEEWSLLQIACTLA